MPGWRAVAPVDSNSVSEAVVQDLDQAIQTGMLIAYHAARRGDAWAVRTGYGDRTWSELNARGNQLARVLRRVGIGDGDAVALIGRNRPEFCEVIACTERMGVRMTPINWHLTGEEIGYIVDNCEAKAFIADAGLGPKITEALAAAPGVRLALSFGGTAAGFDAYDDAIAAETDGDIEQPMLGSRMLYTSGTTGRPKGVLRRTREPVTPQWEGTVPNFDPDHDTDLCTGPGYHAAPLLIDILQPLASGVGIVMMDKWSPEETLRLIETHRVTHSHMVATMFHRLLQLPEEVRASADVSSLKRVVHGAAPCPVHVKQSMIDWFGPVIWEYYAATEGGGGFLVGSEEWLTKPGTVGRPGPEFDNRIMDDDGNVLGANEVGTIYMRAPAQGRFEYFKDSDKTDRSYRGDYFTLGDMGYFDGDGYLFLTGRTAELIISGGVNIYPQEVDAEVLKHEAVLDICTIGVPNDEWGEEVKSVILLKEGFAASPELAAAIQDFARERLAAYKCPRSIDFVEDLPRSEAGKIQRRKVREPYWEGRERQI